MRPTAKPAYFLRDILPRVLADSAFLCAALFFAFTTYFIFYVVYWKDFPNQVRLLHDFWGQFIQNAFLLVLLGIVVFAISGFYTHTRAYQTRYKLLVIVNAVTLAFLIEVVLDSYIFRMDPVPRGVMLLAWLFSLLAIAGSRMAKDHVILSYTISPKAKAKAREIQRVLIVGGAGYIGSTLSRQLLDAGYSVRVLDSLLFGDSPISDLLGHPHFELLRADFRHIESLVKATNAVDAVIHLAAIVGDPACTIDADLTMEINYAATRMLVEVSKGAGISRLLFASTCSVYGASDILMDELAAPAPVSLYARTKLDSERVILDSKSATLHPTCLRLGTVFGLSRRPRFDLVVNLLTARAVRDKQITIFNQEQWRPFIHVNDVGRAFIQALEAPSSVVSGEIFNVGSSDLNFTLGQVAERIQKHVPEVQVDHKQNPDRRNYRVSFDKIHSHLGLECKTTLDEGIEEIRNAIETGLVKDYRDRAFSNYEYLLDNGSDLLRSEPHVQLFTALEPAEADRPVAPSDMLPAGAGS